ncbi:MAG: DUF4276 family protein [Zoogloea sp.]|nr:DUF4276 family protein [Zoogloea sp.]MCA0187619.1 DUF4276 family protein [Pseudomonadota bacterium]
MREVIVFAEGSTEERFIRQVVAPALHSLQIYLKPQLLNTSSSGKGGALSIERFLRNARNTLRQNPGAVLTSFIDLYGLDTDFPAFESSKKLTDVQQRVAYLEAALHEQVISRVGCAPERFIPHIQPYEYEGLLFSDVSSLTGTEPSWSQALASLQKIRDAFASPEHINDGYETKPSKRLENLLHPKYRKALHGPRAAARISLGTMERECAHFRGWMERLRGLAG